MSPPQPSLSPLSAPDLIGPISILNQPVSGPGSKRQRLNRVYRHAHLEVDLVGAPKAPKRVHLLERLESLLSVRKEVEAADLLRLTAATLHALSARRFRWIDHWEVQPRGWLPPPTREDRTATGEPVGQFLTALTSGEWTAAPMAKVFSVRLSDREGNHVDLVLRRVHPRSRHALSLDVWGHWTRVMIEGVSASLSSRLPVAKVTLTRFQVA
jgi:hypothetical protein